MSSLPTPLRAALGIALSVVDTARETATHLPQKAAGLPVAVASQAVQLSLRAQQQYAAYVNKGDELIGAFRGAPEEPPAWATFDEDEPTPARNTAFDRVPDAEDELAELQALDDLEGLADEVGDHALDLLDGSYEAADGPRPTPGAPATTDETDVTSDAVGDEVIGADAPRTTASREPARKATRKIATKASRKVAATKAPPAKKAAKKAAPPPPTPGATGGLPPSPAAKKAAKAAKAAKKAAKKAAPPPSFAAETPLFPADSTLPTGPDADTRPDDVGPDEV